MPLIDCLELAKDIVDDKVKKRLLDRQANLMKEGMSEKKAGQTAINEFANEYGKGLNEELNKLKKSIKLPTAEHKVSTKGNLDEINYAQDRELETASGDKKYPEFREKVLDNLIDQKDSSFDFRITSELSQAEREKGAADIRAGKNTVAARKVEKLVKEIYDSGVISLNRGRGNHTENVEFTHEQWFGNPLTEKEIQAIDKVSDVAAEIIKSEGITADNIENFKHLFDGFPYEAEDYEAVKDYLTRESKRDNGIERANKEGESSQEEEVIPPEPPQEQVEPSSERPETGIKHAATEEKRKEYGLEERDKPSRTDKEIEAAADEMISEGYDAEKLVQKLESGTPPTAEENFILKKYLAGLEAAFEKNRTDENLAKVERVYKAVEKIGTIQSEQFRTRKGFTPQDDSLAGFFIAKKEANNTDILTEQQKAETEKQFNAYKEKADKAEAKAAEYEAKYNDLLAQKELEKQKKTPRGKKTHEDLIKERKDIVVDIKEKLRKARGQASATVVPYANELIAIAPDVAKLMVNLVHDGVLKLEDVITKIHEQLKEDIPDITVRDVRDIIAGVYTETSKTRNELAADLRTLKTQAQLLIDYEKALKGEPKTEKEKIRRNEKITQFKKDLGIDKLEQLEAYKKRIETDTKKIQERIAKGEFEKEKPAPLLENKELQKKFPKQYNDLINALWEKEEAKHQLDIALAKDELSRRGKIRKTFDLASAIIATSKAVVAGIDDSALFIQNIAALAAHPQSAAKAIPGHVKDFFSERNFNRWLTALHNSSSWDLIKKSGLDVTEPASLRAQEKEEIFDNNLLNKQIKIKGKTYKIGKYTTAPFERAFTGLGNRMRVDAFLRLAQKLMDEGYTFENDPKKFKDLATVLNTETGRGKILQPLDRIAQFVSSGIWSPKLMASRFNLLGFGDIAHGAFGKKGYYASLDPKIRAMAVKDVAQFIGAGVAIMGVAAAAGADVDADPRSVTFGTIGVGNKRYNIWGGFSQYVRLIAQGALGVQKKGNEVKEKNRLETLGRFMRGKLTPAVGSLTDVVAQKNFFGAPIDYKEEATELITPLAVGDIAKEIKRDGIASILYAGIPSFVGVNVSDERDYPAKEKSNSRSAAHRSSAGGAPAHR